MYCIPTGTCCTQFYSLPKQTIEAQYGESFWTLLTAAIPKQCAPAPWCTRGTVVIRELIYSSHSFRRLNATKIRYRRDKSGIKWGINAYDRILTIYPDHPNICLLRKTRYGQDTSIFSSMTHDGPYHPLTTRKRESVFEW